MNSFSKQIFVSWTKKDEKKIKKYMDKIFKKTGLTYYLSDGSCIGQFETWFEETISIAPYFLVYISKNALLSQYMPSEIELAIKKYEKLDYKMITFISELEEKEIKKLDKENIFYKLIIECKVSGVFTSNGEKNVINQVSEKLTNMIPYYDFHRYSKRLNNELNRFISFGDISIRDLSEVYIERKLQTVDGIEFDNLNIINENSILIMGEAGSGKSTYIQHVAKLLNDKNTVFILKNNDIMKIIKNDYSIMDYLYIKLKYEITEDTFEKKIKTQKCILIIEGLDEVISINKAKLISKIDEFNKSYSNFKFIYTSRNSEEISDCVIVKLKELDENELYKLAQKYINLYIREENVCKQFYQELNNIDKEIKFNPLLLSQLAYVYSQNFKLPTNKLELYEEIIDLLINIRNRDSVEYNLNNNIRNFIENYEEILSETAFYLMINQNDKSFMNALNKVIKNHSISRDIYDYLKNRNIIDEEYGFKHNTFLEYFVALYIFKKSFSKNDISGYIPNENLNELIANDVLLGNYEMLLLIIDKYCEKKGIQESLKKLLSDTSKYFYLLKFVKNKSIFGYYLLEPIFIETVEKKSHPYHELLYFTVKNNLFIQLLELAQKVDNEDINYTYAFVHDILVLYSDINIKEYEKLYSANIKKLRNDGSWRYRILSEYYLNNVKNELFVYENDPYNIYKNNCEKLIGHIIVDDFDQLKYKTTNKVIGLSVLNYIDFNNNEISFYNRNIELYVFPKELKKLTKKIGIDNKLEKIKIIGEITEISSGLFTCWDYLKEIYLPDSIEIIGEGAFVECTSLEKIKIPSKARCIRTMAFAGCLSLEEIDLPEGMNEIGDNAFSCCRNLSRIKLPKSITEVGERIFEYSDNIKEIEYSGDYEELLNNSSWIVNFFEMTQCTLIVNENGCRKQYNLSDCINNIIQEVYDEFGFDDEVETEDFFDSQCDQEDNKNVQIINLSEGTEIIGNGAFEGYTNLEEISIPESVKKIEKNAFANCFNLKKIIFSQGLEEISDGAFYGCSNLEEVILPEGLTFIGEEAFKYCYRLNKIQFPESLVTIEKNAFECCSELCEIKLPEGLEKLGSGVFTNCSNIKHINIPSQISEINSWTFGECINLEEINLPLKLEKIGAGAFQNCKKLKLINLPNELLFIGPSAFDNCESLERIEIPRFVTELESNLFHNCYNLKEIILHNSILEVQDCVFENCYSLKSIIWPKNVETISYSCFCGCKSLEEVENLDEISEIGLEGFSSCTSLKKVNLKKVQIIYNSAFQDCETIEDIKLYENANSIEAYAFKGCKNLKNVFLPDSVYSIGDQAFYDCDSLQLVCLPKTFIDDISLIFNNNEIIKKITKSEFETRNNYIIIRLE